MKKLQIFGFLILFVIAGIAVGSAQTPPPSIHGKFEKWVVKKNSMQLTYYSIADFQTYMNAIVQNRKAPDLTKNNKAAVVIVDLPSRESVDSIKQLFADQYLVIATDPAKKQIILTKIIPGNVFQKRIGVIGFRLE